ncbi:MAG: 30S ribosome-binding factor RbfA [Gammaproteobacteria bacterium]|nr:30S ribosome-binding factor RbfA [Gammaproteobacteria bacterium]
MARDYPRSYRVADQIQRELAQLIRTELKDPRVSELLTISSVDVSRDLSIAKIYYTVLNEEQRADTEEALTQGAGYLRKLLSNRLTMRSVPQLRFIYDTTLEEGARLSGLIDKAVKSNTTTEDES